MVSLPPYSLGWVKWQVSPIPDRLTAQFDNIQVSTWPNPCLLYTSDAADERSSVDLGGRRIINKKKKIKKKTQHLHSHTSPMSRQHHA